MTKAPAPAFALVAYQALSRNSLMALRQEIVNWDESFATRDINTNDALKALIKEARAAYYDRQAAPAPKASPARISTLCSITAAECNAWLKTLPLNPFAGDA